MGSIAKMMDIADITLDSRLQLREKTIDKNDPIVIEYAELLQEWTPDNMLMKCPLGEVRIIYDKETYWLIDGWHRIHAAMKNGLTKYPAIIEEGTFKDAQRKMLNVNAKHGLPRTNKEKRKAVELALDDLDLDNKTQSNIARIAGVSQAYVNKVIDERKNGKPTPKPYNVINQERENGSIGNNVIDKPNINNDTSPVEPYNVIPAPEPQVRTSASTSIIDAYRLTLDSQAEVDAVWTYLAHYRNQAEHTHCPICGHNCNDVKPAIDYQSTAEQTDEWA